MMTATHLLGLAPSAGTGNGSTAANAAAPAAAASKPVDAAAAGATFTPTNDAPHVFSALMHGLSVRSKPTSAKADAQDTPVGESTVAAPGDTPEAIASGASDAAVVASENPSQAGHDSDLPGMAMPLLPAAIDLSLTAAAQAAAASVGTAALTGEPRRPYTSATSGPSGPSATADVGGDYALSTWPAAASNARAASAAGSFGAADAAGASGNGVAAAPSLPDTPDVGDRGDAARGQSAPTALSTSTAPLPDASTLGVQNNELGAITVKLPADAPAQWRQALTDALGDRLQVQVSRQIDQAVIRLDPPMLGRIDISISQSSGNLQVHLSASNADVLRQLHDVGASLRQDLSHRQYGDVAVTVAEAQTRGGDPRQRGRQAAPEDARGPGKALAEAEAGSTQTTYRSLSGRE